MQPTTQSSAVVRDEAPQLTKTNQEALNAKQYYNELLLKKSKMKVETSKVDITKKERRLTLMPLPAPPLRSPSRYSHRRHSTDVPRSPILTRSQQKKKQQREERFGIVVGNQPDLPSIRPTVLASLPRAPTFDLPPLAVTRSTIKTRNLPVPESSISKTTVAASHRRRTALPLPRPPCPSPSSTQASTIAAILSMIQETPETSTSVVEENPTKCKADCVVAENHSTIRQALRTPRSTRVRPADHSLMQRLSVPRSIVFPRSSHEGPSNKNWMQFLLVFGTLIFITYMTGDTSITHHSTVTITSSVENCTGPIFDSSATPSSNMTCTNGELNVQAAIASPD
jgi:hypothetical protein